MDKLQRQVREFHRTVLHQPHSPALPAIRNGKLRARLIAEEAIETICALVGGAEAQNVIHELLVKELQKRSQKGKSGANLVEVIDGLCDLAVVTYGTAEDIGIDLEPFADEVMRSNMDKVGGPVDEHGKQGKPPGWRDADIAGVLDREMSKWAHHEVSECRSLMECYQHGIYCAEETMSDLFDKKKMTDPVQRPTARDALAYAKPEHGHCTVVAKNLRSPGNKMVVFKCACGDEYVIGANQFSMDALRNVPVDMKL